MAGHFDAVLDMLNARLMNQSVVWMREDNAPPMNISAAEAQVAGFAQRAQSVMQSSDEASEAVLWVLTACAAEYAE